MRFLFFALCLMLVSACGHNITPIAKLQLPPLTYIEGTVVKLDGDEGFILRDATGEIAVEYDDGMADFHDLKVGDRLIVKGMMDEEGDEFDAVKIMRPGDCCKEEGKVCCDKDKKSCHGKKCHKKAGRK